MHRLHITQDDYKYWMLSHEKEDGTLILIAHQFENADHVIELALEMVRDGLQALILIDPPRADVRALAAAEQAAYHKPAARKAGA
jgi:hypothetical protein